MARNRIIYASQSVWCNGEVLYRVQSLGTTTTFTSEDLFELGHLDIIDVVDDVPAVAITLNTNDFGDVKTFAVLAQVVPDKVKMEISASSTNANLVVVSGTELFYDTNSTFLHGCALADFAIVCGNLPGITLWAPVQSECSLGTLDDDIEQTLFLDEVYVNSLEFGYTTGANATENYGAETDNKMWLLNDGKFVNFDTYTLDSDDVDVNKYVELTIASGVAIPPLSTGNRGFLRKDTDGNVGVTWYDTSKNVMQNIKILDDTDTVTTTFGYKVDTGTGYHRIYLPQDAIGGYTVDEGDSIQVSYCADAYGTRTDTGADSATNKYFKVLSSNVRPDILGALRQGQIEVYIVRENAADWDSAWRLTGCTITCDLTREPLAELGHLSPYDRPLTMPIPITVTVDSTAGDLENWARFADQTWDGDLDDIDLADLMASEKLKLVVKVYAQTDEEAGGTGSGRKVLTTGSPLVDEYYFNNGVKAGPYTGAGEDEYALKTIIVEHLKITDEGATLDMGANMTQTFGFRSTNDLYVVKGDLDVAYITGVYKVRRNAKY